MNKLIELLTPLKNPVLYATGGNHEFISANIFELTGYYAEEIRMNRDLFPGLINPEDYIETNFKIKNWHKNNEQGMLTIQFRFQSSNGSLMWIEDHLVGLKQDDTKYMVGMMLNVTQQKYKETELLQLRTEWREKESIDETEREAVFADIQNQLDNINAQWISRKKRIYEILNYINENKIPLEQIDLTKVTSK